MISFLLTLNLATSLVMAPNARFNYIYTRLSQVDQNIIDSNNINTDEEFDEFVWENNVLKAKGSSNSSEITDVSKELSEKFPNHRWSMSDSNTTKSVSNAIPINMQGSDFPQADIRTANDNTGVESYYGGCGLIAMMGIMDYFSRYLGYDKYIADPTSSSDRIELAEDVLEKSTTFEIGFENENKGKRKSTLMFPWDYESAFDSLTKDYGLEGVIDASHNWRLVGIGESGFLNTIIENIDKGLPVTLMVGFLSNAGVFNNHYTNIYGYERWVGYDNKTNKRIEETFIKARLNWGGDWDKGDEYYCYASVLNDWIIGIITYNIDYEVSYDVYASDFAEEFVNSSGGGQYFFDNRLATVFTANSRMFYTNRKRCSYIENQYLVLSPNRANAGEAYLDIELLNSAAKMKFSASLWSAREGDISLEEFKIQYYLNGWKDHVNFDLSKLSTLKKFPDEFTILMPKHVTRFRFLATHSNPTGSRNLGRIVLDDFTFEYNY